MITQSKATYSSDELAMMLTAYMEAVEDMPLCDLVEACRRWPKLPERGKWWPMPEELRALADDIACEHRVRALPKPEPVRHDAPVQPGPVAINDPGQMVRTIADMKANSGQYAAARPLIALGEAMLERWEQQDRARKAERRLEPA